MFKKVYFIEMEISTGEISCVRAYPAMKSEWGWSNTYSIHRQKKWNDVEINKPLQPGYYSRDDNEWKRVDFVKVYALSLEQGIAHITAWAVNHIKEHEKEIQKYKTLIKNTAEITEADLCFKEHCHAGY